MTPPLCHPSNQNLSQGTAGEAISRALRLVLLKLLYAYFAKTDFCDLAAQDKSQRTKKRDPRFGLDCRKAVKHRGGEGCGSCVYAQLRVQFTSCFRCNKTVFCMLLSPFDHM